MKSFFESGIAIWYLAISVVTFMFYVRDKAAAMANLSRTPEKTLHYLALFGGWPGALLAQRLFRHKLSKPSFVAMFLLMVAVNTAVLFGVVLLVKSAHAPM